MFQADAESPKNSEGTSFGLCEGKMPRGKNKGAHVKFRKDRQCWEVVEYTFGKRKRHATGYGSRADAEEKLAEIILRRNAPQKNEQHITLGEIMAYYITEHVPTLPDASTVIKCFDRLIPFWGDLKLDDIRQSKSLEYLEVRKKEFKDWQKKNWKTFERELKPETVKREIEQLQAAIGHAYHRNIISICPYVWRPKGGNARTRWLSKKEAPLLLNEARKYERARDYLPIFILIGLHTGARSKAIFKLRWADIDFASNRIDFTRSYRSSNKKGAVIPIPRRLRGHLLRHRKRGVEMGYVVHIDQKPIKSVKKSFAEICRRAGLEGVTPNTLRHTAASWRIQSGQSSSKVARFLGHSTSQMVETTYGHMATNHLEDVADAY